MPEKHNRILLGPETKRERDIKENQGEIEGTREKREQEFFTHTTSFLIFGGSVD